MEHDPPFDAIVVLGTRVRVDGSASVRLQSRVEHALRLFLDGQATCLVLSGGPPNAAVSEAVAMARLAEAAGVPRSSIVLEPDSGSTWDNARLTAALLRKRDCSRILLVTDAQHMPRAALVFRATGLVVSTDAAAWRSARGLPRIVLNVSYETAASLVYRLRLLRRRHELSG